MDAEIITFNSAQHDSLIMLHKFFLARQIQCSYVSFYVSFG